MSENSERDAAKQLAKGAGQAVAIEAATIFGKWLVKRPRVAKFLGKVGLSFLAK